MKYLKLGLILVAILAVIIGALLISGGDYTNHDIVTYDNSAYTTCMKEIEDNWQKAKKWDTNIYNKNFKIINTYTDIYSFSAEDSTSLAVYNSTLAFNLVHRDIFAEWNKRNCDNKTINNLYSATETIKKNESFAAGNKELQKIKDCKSIYDTIRNLTCAEISPEFDKKNSNWKWIGDKEWNSYAEYDNEMRQKLTVLQNKIFYEGYLTNSCKLYADKYLEALNTTKRYAYNTLAMQIIANYPIPNAQEQSVWDNIDFYTNEKEKLESLQQNYEEEYTINDDLKKHVKKYRNNPIFKDLEQL